MNVQKKDTDARHRNTAGVTAAGVVPDFGEYDAAVELLLGTGRNERLVISFQGIGPRYRGFIGVVGYFFVDGPGVTPVESPIFQINYEESIESAKKRFSTWLDSTLVRGLNAWRRSL